MVPAQEAQERRCEITLWVVALGRFRHRHAREAKVVNHAPKFIVDTGLEQRNRAFRAVLKPCEKVGRFLTE